jgi:GNAT superfamily N-acetyltransferase
MKIDISLMKATVQDLSLLTQMNKELIEDEGSLNPMSIDQLEQRMLNWLTTDDWEVDLVLLAGGVIGYALYQFRVHSILADAEEVYLRQYFIRRRYRGNGIGLAGIQLLKDSRFEHVKTIVIDVLLSNPKGIRFWQKAGFFSYYMNMRLETK